MVMERVCGRPTINEKGCDMAEELWRASAVELVAGIRDKRFSCVEVMTSVVERIRALNPNRTKSIPGGRLILYKGLPMGEGATVLCPKERSQ
jgi:hypothetical protein